MMLTFLRATSDTYFVEGQQSVYQAPCWSFIDLTANHAIVFIDLTLQAVQLTLQASSVDLTLQVGQ